MGKALAQYHVHPFLEQGRAGIHIQGMLENDDVMLTDQLPLMVNIDEKKSG